MRSTILLFFFTTLLNAVSAQKNGIVRGFVFDSINNHIVSGATVTLLKKKDSSLVSFTMTDNKGLFEITGLAEGDYRLFLTHINYHNSSTHFSITTQQADLEGKVILGIKDSLIQQRFQNLLPNARLQYNVTRYKHLSLNYSTNTTQPTMNQLQPVPDISDPLNIRA